VKPLGVGLLGAGRHGARYIHHLREDVPAFRLVAVGRRDPERAAALERELGVTAVADWRDLVAHPAVDVVLVVVPPQLHEPIVLEAAARGKPVLLEKPAAVSLAAGRRMLDAVRRAGIPVQVAQTMRYNEIVRLLLAERERVGPIYGIRIGQHMEREPRAYVEEEEAGGGAMLHTGIHAFDLVRVVTGMEADRAWGEIGTAGVGRRENHFAAVLRLGGGRATASVSGSRVTGSRSGAIEIVGERGQLVADVVARTAAFVLGKTAQSLAVPPEVSTVREALRDFAGALAAGRPVSIPLEEGLRSLALVEAVYAAARSGRAAPVPSV
jgi:predicted dehydrogenase